MKKVLIGFSVLLLLLTLLPALPLQYGLIRIWSYPRLQIAVLMILTLIGWAFYRREARKYLILVIALIVANCYQLSKFLPYTFIWKPEIVDTKKRIQDQEISILFYNVYMDNRKTPDFIELTMCFLPTVFVVNDCI